MSDPKLTASASEQAAQQVNDLFDSTELAKAIETEEFRHFLDHIPIAIAVAKLLRGDQRIVYANKSFEAITGRTFADIGGRGWSFLDEFRREDDEVSFSQALRTGDEYLGTFRPAASTPTLIEGYSGIIENDDGTEDYRIVALIDVTQRERAQREEFARQIRDKDTMLKEVQHRVKNNLQLITALIRLEIRNERRGDKINLPGLAGRIEALQLLYQAMAAEALGDEIDLGHYLNQIAGAVMNAHAVEGIRLDMRVDHTPISINIAMPVGLLVNEFMTNAFKHAFGGRGHGVIKLQCLRSGPDRYLVTLADDGVGMADGAVWPLPGKISALLVQTLRENAQADFTMRSAPDTGTRVSIALPHKAPKRKVN